jgi:hypothetical protein
MDQVLVLLSKKPQGGRSKQATRVLKLLPQIFCQSSMTSSLTIPVRESELYHLSH